MANDQLKNLTNSLEKLIQENPSLFNQEEINSSLVQESSYKVIAGLIDTIQRQNAEIESNRQSLLNYQSQTQGLHSKLIRNKPRRLSLDNGESSSFVNIGSPVIAMSRRSSSRSDQGGLFSPFLSPQTPLSARSLSPIIPEIDYISSLVEERENELAENASEVINELQTSEDNLYKQVSSLAHQLSQKEGYIIELEKDREEQNEKIVELEKIQIKSISLQNDLTKQKELIQKLEEELKETNNDFLLETEKNNVLIKEILETRQIKAELEKRLEHVVDEMRRLENSKEQTYSVLLAKYNEISQTKQSVEKEREELANLIKQQEVDYLLDKEWREKKFQKQMDNLRSFQINGDNSKKTSKMRHSYSYSVSSIPLSRSNSYDMEIKNDTIVFSSRPTTPLSAELKQKGFAEKGGKISNNLSNSPVDYQGGNIFDISFERSNKRMSAPPLKPSPLIPTSSPKDNKNDDTDIMALLGIDNILNDIDNLGITEEEHSQLKAEKDALESSTQKLNERLLKSEEEKKDCEYELGQTKYELKEVQSRKTKIEKELQEAKDKVDKTEAELINKKRESNELAIKNEILQDELDKIKNEKDSQRISFASLANNVNQLEENNEEKAKQLEKLEKLNQQQDLRIKELEENQQEAVCLDGLEEKERELSAVIEQAEAILKISKYTYE